MSKRKVLVTGDRDSQIQELCNGLLRYGYDAVAAAQFGDLPNGIRNYLPDVVLLEIPSGGEDDRYDADRIQNDFDIPLILLAASAEPSTLDWAKTIGPYGYLTEPYRMVDVANAITIALQKYGVERDLRERESRFRAALNSVGTGMVVTNSAGQILFLNDRSRQMFDLAEGDVTGQGWSNVLQLQSKITGLPAGDLAQLAILHGRAMDAGKDLIVTSRSGEIQQVEGEVAPYGTDGEPSGIIFTFRDVTVRNYQEEHNRQEQRSQAVARLADVIAKQIAPLLHTAIEESDRALNLLQRDDAARDPVEAIRTKVEDLSRVARQLSAISSYEPSYPQTVDLNALIEDACSVLRQRLPAEIDLITNLSPELVEIRADPAEIIRAIDSLVVRARADMQKGGEIQIKTRNCAYVRNGPGREIKRYVTLTISDTGVGFPESESQRLFEPKSKNAQLDLGLYSVHSIIDNARGAICAESNPDVGTRFEILLPQALAASSGIDSGADGSVYASQDQPAVVLVQHDAAVRDLLGICLENLGCEVLGASDFTEALNWLDYYDGPITMLVTDLALHEMSGVDLARKFLLEHPALKTLFLSDQQVDPVVKASWSDEGTVFLVRPFRLEDFRSSVNQMLDISGVRHSVSGRVDGYATG